MLHHPAARVSLIALGAAAVFAAVSTASSPNAAEHAVASIVPYTAAHAGVVVGSGVNAHARVLTPGRRARSIVKLRATGLSPGSRYGVHVHSGTCADYLGHYRYELSGPGTRDNEIWLDLTSTSSGRARDRVTVPRFNPAGLSIVIHQMANPDQVPDPTGHPGDRIACGNFTQG